MYVQYQAIFRAGNVSNKYIVYTLVPINVISGSVNAATKSLRPYLRKQQQDIQFDAKVTAPKDLVVVLAVGESSRRKNFSLYGYARQQTNPVLQQVGGLHLLNGEATRGSTLYALPMILEKNGIKLTTVTSRAGIPTACLVNYTMYDNCAAVGEIKVHDCAHAGKCYDEDVIPLLKQNLQTYSSGQRSGGRCISAAAVTGRCTWTGIRRSSSGSSPCAGMPTLPTSVRSRSSTTRTTTPSCMSITCSGRRFTRSTRRACPMCSFTCRTTASRCSRTG